MEKTPKEILEEVVEQNEMKRKINLMVVEKEKEIETKRFWEAMEIRRIEI